MMTEFEKEATDRIAQFAHNSVLRTAASQFMTASILQKYSYNWFWLGRPIIQYPQDIVAMQELIWSVRPDLIIETGVAHGGSLVFSASMLALLDLCDETEPSKARNSTEPRRRVLGLDIDIRPHNRAAIDAHPLHRRIDLIEGSSVDPAVIDRVRAIASKHERILICLDSNHTHEHVLAELTAYAPLTTVGSYCVVFDTVVEDLPSELCPDRPWGAGNNPKTAVWKYLEAHPEFVIDVEIQNKLMITVAPDGYLKRIR